MTGTGRGVAIRIILALFALAIWCGGITPAHAASPNFFASVSAAGALVHGNNVSGTTHLGPGRYEVTFTSPVDSCGYVATTVRSGTQATTVFTASGHLSANGVYIETKNQGGGLADFPFDLVVNCGLTGMSYAVVGYSADLVRSTAGVILTPLGGGRYNVTFPSTVSGCAFLATVGDPGSGIALAPNGVYTGSGPNGHTVYVETKNPGGGLADGVPFHLVVVCAAAKQTHFAVVNASGIPARGSKLTSSFKLDTGEYALVTNAAIGACAAVATRGSVNKSVPFDPATVELVAGPGGTNTIGIEVKSLLFFGGDLVDEAFHAAIVC